MRRLVLPLFSLIFICAGCSKTKTGAPLDAKIGIVSRDYKIEATRLTPISVSLDSKHKYFYMSDHFVFLGEKDTLRYVLTVSFNRGLDDNDYIRGSREFSGFLFDGKDWVTLPYTKMKHDSTRLETNYDYIFGGLSWSEPNHTGSVRYDRHNIKFEFQFSELKPVHQVQDGKTSQHAHAIGSGTLLLPNDTIVGVAFYELLQLDGYNPIAKATNGIDYTNFDWLALRTTDGSNMLVMSDSTTVSDRLLKNFFAMEQRGKILYADGSDRVRIASKVIQRDYQIYDWLALKKSLLIPELDVSLQASLTKKRIFYTNGYCLALVEGTLTQSGASQNLWGILEHRQQPKSSSEVLK